jgi:hypothetical protein
MEQIIPIETMMYDLKKLLSFIIDYYNYLKKENKYSKFQNN